MKVLIVTSILLLGSLEVIHAQPVVVKHALKQKYPNSLISKWEKVNTDYWKASFSLGGRKTTAMFDQEGHWIESSQEIDLEDIGIMEVKSAIKREFASCKILSIIIFNNVFVGTHYDVQGKCGDEIRKLSFNWNGEGWPPKITFRISATKIYSFIC